MTSNDAEPNHCLQQTYFGLKSFKIVTKETIGVAYTLTYIHFQSGNADHTDHCLFRDIASKIMA